MDLLLKGLKIMKSQYEKYVFVIWSTSFESVGLSVLEATRGSRGGRVRIWLTAFSWGTGEVLQMKEASEEEMRPSTLSGPWLCSVLWELQRYGTTPADAFLMGVQNHLALPLNTGGECWRYCNCRGHAPQGVLTHAQTQALLGASTMQMAPLLLGRKESTRAPPSYNLYIWILNYLSFISVLINKLIH